MSHATKVKVMCGHMQLDWRCKLEFLMQGNLQVVTGNLERREKREERGKKQLEDVEENNPNPSFLIRSIPRGNPNPSFLKPSFE